MQNPITDFSKAFLDVLVSSFDFDSQVVKTCDITRHNLAWERPSKIIIINPKIPCYTLKKEQKQQGSLKAKGALWGFRTAHP